MNVTCNKCGKKYVISDDKVAGKTSVKIRCKQCQNLIAVAVTSSSSPSGAYTSAPSGAYRTTASGTFTSAPSGTFASPAAVVTPPEPPAPSADVVWHAMIGGKQQGPFDLATVQQKIGQGEVTVRTYLWKAGMADWKRAADVPEVAAFFSGPAGATATSAVQGSRSSTRNAAVQRDVAVANEVPSEEFARQKPSTVIYGGAQAQAAVAAARAAAEGGSSTDTGSPSASATQPQPSSSLNAHDLFNDINPAASAQHAPADAAGSHEADPFAQLAPVKEGEAPPPGEATKFFIARAGVNKRNPPWKIALFVLGGIGIPLGLTWVLNTFHIVELPTVTHTTEDGKEVEEPIFSTGGMSGLKDVLTGDTRRKKEEAERLRKQKEAVAAAAKAQQQKATGTTPSEPADDPPVQVKPQDPNLAALYGENQVGNTKLKIRKPAGETTAPTEVNTSGLSDEAAGKVIKEKSKAFQQCVETALHRNPKLAVGNIVIVMNIGTSGVVKSASVQPAKYEGADWAQCMTSAAKRIIFPSSDGETTIQAPFKVGVAVTP